MFTDCINTQATSAITATLAALTTIFSATTAYRSFKLTREIHQDTRLDEKLIIGTISHPGLVTRSHADSVIQIPIFNKSKRKAYIDGVSVFDKSSKPIEVTWSQGIDELGNIKDPHELIGIIDSVTLFIRRNDGEEFKYARVLFSHSFSDTRDVIIFDSAALLR